MNGSQLKNGETFVRGVHEDTIELSGYIRQSFKGKSGFIGFSSGVLLSVLFTPETEWRFRIYEGLENVRLYTKDTAIIKDAEWAVFGQEYGVVL